MRRGFTLIELMVVAGIMAFLGTAAVGGYNAFQRGMAERGATGAASALLKAAKERAMIDRAPTMVICFNRLIREADDDENGIAVGEAVAVRRAGRLTYVNGTSLVDEFADILGSYDVVEADDMESRGGMRLWKFPDRKTTSPEYSVIADAVRPLVGDVVLRTYEGWANGETADAAATADLSSETPRNGATHVTTQSGNMNNIAYAFEVLDPATAQWKVGTGYGFEFARMQLPRNFAFDGNIPTNLKDMQVVKVLYFDPEQANDETVDVIFCLPDASGAPKRDHGAGQATSEGNTRI